MKKLQKFQGMPFSISLLLLALLFLMVVLYIKNFAAIIALRANLNTWVQLAGSISALDDYSKNQKGFYQLDASAKQMSVIGSREGYPIRAWAFPRDTDGSNQRFVDEYNSEMAKLINAESSTH